MRQKFANYDDIAIDTGNSTEYDFDCFFNEYYEDGIIENLDKRKIKRKKAGRDKCDLSEKNNEELCIIYQSGNKEALERLIVKNEGLIYSRVEKYKNTYRQDLADEDLFQEGAIGMITAAKRFDAELGYKFSTYATHWIDQSITRKIENEGFTIRLPVHVFENVNRLRRELSEIEMLDINREKKIELLKKYTGFSIEEIYNLNAIYKNILNKSSLNIPITSENSSGSGEKAEMINLIRDDNMANPFDEVAAKLFKIDMMNVLSSLNDRERDILLKRFGFYNDREETLEEIGIDYGLTRERIRQIEAVALDKLRNPLRSKKIRDYMYE